VLATAREHEWPPERGDHDQRGQPCPPGDRQAGRGGAVVECPRDG
jgi:hypothetical protein